MVQDKELSTSKEKSAWRKMLWVAKLVVTCLILTYIYNTFRSEQKGIKDIGVVFSRILVPGHYTILACMLLLVPINWALESLKWQRLAQKAVSITFWESFRGTLTGLAVGVAAPAQLGDTIGRVAALRSANRLNAIGAALVSNGIQFYVSLAGGALGLFFVGDSLKLNPVTYALLKGVLLFLVLLGVLVVWFRKRLTSLEPRRPFAKKTLSYFKIIGAYSGKDLMISTTYGLIRYIVFLSQFVLALTLFNFPLNLAELSSCVALIFLAKTLIPAVNVLGDLGLREFTALFVFKHYNLPAEEIITATFLVWIVNVFAPIMIGIFLIWKYKWKGLN